jgi:mRNA-degrading endonuclease RelE of RelBE toxin-antitoxin system
MSAPGSEAERSKTFSLERIPSKVERFLRRLDPQMQKRIAEAFSYIYQSPFRHENPTVIRKLRGRKKGLYRFRIGKLRFIYRVNVENKTIVVLQMDNRGDIYIFHISLALTFLFWSYSYAQFAIRRRRPDFIGINILILELEVICFNCLLRVSEQ